MVEAMEILQQIGQILAFLVLTLMYSVRSLVNFFIPAAYEPVKNVKGDVILITGGGSGLGRLLSIKLSKLGAKIVIWDVNEKGMEETVKMVKSNGGTIHHYKVDITKREEVYKVAEQVKKDAGDITILINNAGVVSGYHLLDIPDHLIQRTFEVNAISHFWTTKAFLPSMISNKRGHIVTIASMAGHMGCSKLVDYCSSKFAAVGFDESLRVELEALGVTDIKTTCVCPFFIHGTGMFGDVAPKFTPVLTTEQVSESVILGILREDLYVMLPKSMRYSFWVKWILPWQVISMYMRHTVPDACPTPGMK
nr:estradiol 17-beta-dehydrogenase 11 [Onthophagus taurus]